MAARQDQFGERPIVYRGDGGLASIIVAALIILVVLQFAGVVNVWDLGGKLTTTVGALKDHVPPALKPATLPTAPAAVVPPAVVPAGAVVVPQGKPDLATAVPVPPTIVPVVTTLPAAMYSPPTPVLSEGAAPIGPAECNSQNATYRAEKDVTVDTTPVGDGNAIPLGHIAAWSCTSQAEVVANMNAQETEMVNKFLHP